MLWNVGMAMISFHWLLFHSFFILLFYFLWGDSRPDGRLPLMSNRTEKESNVGKWMKYWVHVKKYQFKAAWGSKQSRYTDVALPEIFGRQVHLVCECILWMKSSGRNACLHKMEKKRYKKHQLPFCQCSTVYLSFLKRSGQPPQTESQNHFLELW